MPTRDRSSRDILSYFFPVGYRFKTLANVESLWLGVKIERRLGSRTSMEQLSSQLRVRYPKSREVELLDRGAFDE